jgi:hypothetical protein
MCDSKQQVIFISPNPANVGAQRFETNINDCLNSVQVINRSSLSVGVGSSASGNSYSIPAFSSATLPVPNGSLYYTVEAGDNKGSDIVFSLSTAVLPYRLDKVVGSLTSQQGALNTDSFPPGSFGVIAEITVGNMEFLSGAIIVNPISVDPT